MGQITLIQGDCLERMAEIPDESVDMILCDLPYGTTACAWDLVIPFEPLWAHYERLIKDNGAIVLTASQPFTTTLIASNMKLFRYEWIWEKGISTGFPNANRKPLKAHENICVFYKKQPIYNPQFTAGAPYKAKGGKRKDGATFGPGSPMQNKTPIVNEGRRYPRSVQFFSNPNFKSLHPTQKPVALMKYLVRTYTSDGDLVLDNCMGSGTTGVACINTGRRFIGIEKDPAYFEIAERRIREAEAAPTQLRAF